MVRAGKAVRGSPERRGNGPTGRTLLRRFDRDRAQVLRFLDDFSVPFDNNGAERDLRMLKLQQKTAGCFRTSTGATVFCRIRSYVSSIRKQRRGTLKCLKRALHGHPADLLRPRVTA